MYQSQIGDSTLLNVQATTLLQNAATLQANILAWNDTYSLTAAISAGTLVWVFWRLIRLRLTARICVANALPAANNYHHFISGVSYESAGCGQTTGQHPE